MARWILLSYRLPREPSRPRLALWRALRRLGAQQVNDGLAVLPLSGETREQFDWLATGVEEDGGVASVWLADGATRDQDRQWEATMRESSAEEYASLLVRARTGDDPAAIVRLRRTLREELRRVRARDYFRAPGGAEAEAAIESLQPSAAVVGR
jgi:hypothetical protein